MNNLEKDRIYTDMAVEEIEMVEFTKSLEVY